MNSSNPDVATDEDDVFDKIMGKVGMKGPFQTRFNLVFNMMYILLIALPNMNLIIALAVPEHWCHVPGRDSTNFTLDQWKEMTLPRQEENNELSSQCTMFNRSIPADTKFLSANETAGVLDIVDCQFGWEYDTTWYTMTIPSQENWVCGNELKITNTFAIARIADVIGAFVFGQLADIIGRRPIFFVVVFFIVVGRVTSAFVTGNFILFVAATSIASLVASASFQSPLIISTEVSAPEDRAKIAMMQCIGWTAGLCIIPLIAWLVGDWFTFMLITSIPCAGYFLLYKHFPESPRWLAATGKPLRCMESLRYICSVNGTKMPENTQQMLEGLAIRKEKTYGLASLFLSWRMTMNTTIIIISWVVNSMIYYTLALNVTNLAGNPFMNFFWQSLVELPGYITGKILSDRYGRRWTQSGTFFVIPWIFFFIVGIIDKPNLQWLFTTLVILVKYLITVSFYVVYLLSMEIFPTCVRQTGSSFGYVVANGLGVLGPYIVYLGTAFDMRYPYVILGIMALFGAVVTAFLPETLNHKLPETLADAQNFGKDQKFWHFQDYTKTKPGKEKNKGVLGVNLNEKPSSGVV